MSTDYRTLASVPAHRSLALANADCEEGAYISTRLQSGKVYDIYVGDGYVEELESLHPSYRVFRTTPLGRVIYGAIPHVTPGVFAAQLSHPG